MLRRLFSFQGRVNRAKFWAFYIGGSLAVDVIIIALIAIGSAWSNGTPQLDILNGTWPQTPAGWVSELSATLLYFVFAYAMMAQLVQRLHDRDKPAWWLAVFWGPTLALFAATFTVGRPAMTQFPMPGAALILGFFAAWLIMVWFLVEILFLPGTSGNNRFGSDPRAPKAAI